MFSYQLDIGIGFNFHSNQILEYGPRLIFVDLANMSISLFKGLMKGNGSF